ncbi:Transcription cofactor vestigial-like protein 4 [Popillia japonica]|uniref:Transcription cofactor vestigial-like protein 4 n=1 Tax=Popillia japonica TaxID=7064 RepID=A0AAW1NA16_POPJA
MESAVVVSELWLSARRRRQVVKSEILTEIESEDVNLENRVRKVQVMESEVVKLRILKLHTQSKAVKSEIESVVGLEVAGLTEIEYALIVPYRERIRPPSIKIAMEVAESPLEVLSRAATMVQENQQQSLSSADESTKQNSTKQLPTTKWKRDRRNRNEYSRKSDPKLPENFGQDPIPGSPEPSSPQSHAPPYPTLATNGQSNGQGGKISPDAPLDMSVRQRGQPPSYSQTINNPGYRSSYRPSVITQNSISRDDPPTDESTKQNSTKQLPTTKWKRDRRNRNEYSRKSDPKLPENFGQDPIPGSPEPSSPQSHAPPYPTLATNGQSNGQGGKISPDAPLDMSVRQRGQPPSYSQTINNPGYRSSYRPSVITQNSISRDDPPTGISMCDPIIDEHFRRSLGKDYDYVAIFANNNIPKEVIPPPPKAPASPKESANKQCVIQLMDSEGLTVDDHFAKALGDTWFKLKKQEPEIKNNTTPENPGVVAVSYS